MTPLPARPVTITARGEYHHRKGTLVGVWRDWHMIHIDGREVGFKQGEFQ